jgi:predicted dehydrogenase
MEDANVEVAGLYEPDPFVRAGIADRYGVRIVDSAEEILGSCDGVIIDGFDFENPDLVRLALGHVSAILLEKPGAPTIAAMRELVSQVSAFPVYIQVGYMLEYSPVVTELRRIVSSGVLGQITLGRFHAATPVGCSAEIWQSLTQDEGGLLWTDGCHLMRCIIGLLGPPGVVIGSVRKLPSQAEPVFAEYFKADVFAALGGEAEFHIGELVHEDVAAGVLCYPNMTAVFDITAWEAHAWVEAWRIELFGTDATVEAGLSPAWFRLDVRRDHRDFGRGIYERHFPDAVTAAETSLVVDATYRGEMAAFVAAIRRGSVDQHELRAAARTLETIHRMYESSQSGRPSGPDRGGGALGG